MILFLFEMFLKSIRPAKLFFFLGFSNNTITWLPVNSNYWRLNLELQRNTLKSHFQVYKRLVQLRYHPTLQHGDLTIFTLSKWVLAFTR